MTDSQKEIIITMRAKKSTYASIAEVVGIPANTVKTFCRRNDVTTEMLTESKCCKNCGKKLSSTPKVRTRLFCCDKCKQIWWNKHRGKRVSSKIVSHNCLVCGKIFNDYSGANRKYCSQKCYRKRSSINA